MSSQDAAHTRVKPQLLLPEDGQRIDAIETDDTSTFKLPESKKQKKPSVGWRDLPKKSQLALLACARLSEPLTLSSIRSYMFYQLKWFDPSLSDATIARQAGLLSSTFLFAQFLSGVWWGRAADSEYIGRKNVLLIGLFGTCISCIGYGFAKNFYMALAFRFVGGILNGNVGVMRTMISEMIVEKKFQSRAFMLLPMTGNIGQIIGPIIGGLLAEPVTSFPRIFGPGSLLGGKDGVKWMAAFPYALPNLISAAFLLMSACCIVFGVEETHYMLRDSPDWGIRLGQCLKRLVGKQVDRTGYDPVSLEEEPATPSSSIGHTLEMVESNSPTKTRTPQRRAKLPFRRVFTKNLVVTLLARGFMSMHIGAFQTLWFIFLSTPRSNEKSAPMPHDAFHFTDGLALPPRQIGVIMSILGGLGIIFQITAYPWTHEKFGTASCFRASIALFPLVYFVTPFLATVHSSSKPPLPSAGVLVWGSIFSILGVHVMGRTFAIPSSTILVNNACPHPSVLSTVHSLAMSVNSGMLMFGPLAGGLLFSLGLDKGMVGLAFWVLMCQSCIGLVFGMLAREGSGHEIILEGDEDTEISRNNK